MQVPRPHPRAAIPRNLQAQNPLQRTEQLTLLPDHFCHVQSLTKYNGKTKRKSLQRMPTVSGHLPNVSCARRQTLKRTKNKSTIHLRNASTMRRLAVRIHKTCSFCELLSNLLIQLWRLSNSLQMMKYRNLLYLCTNSVFPIFSLYSTT